MGAPDVLSRLIALGVHLSKDGDSLIAEPRSALTDEARAMIVANKNELLAALESPSESRRRRALAYLADHPEARRFCLIESEGADLIIVCVAVREPLVTVEIAVNRDRFDPFALMDLSLRYPNTAVNALEH